MWNLLFGLAISYHLRLNVVSNWVAHEQQQKLFRDVLFLSALLIVLFVDQVSKQVLQIHLSLGESWPEHGPFRLTLITNSGGLFGIMPGYTAFFTLASLAGIVLLIFLYRTQIVANSLMRLSFALLLGGAIGNLIDRLRYDYVIDFIDIGPWPIFNIADSSIVIGVTLLAKVVFFTSPSRKSNLSCDDVSLDQEGCDTPSVTDGCNAENNNTSS
ncbi:signal peptidase II [SAR202 cluster bacterium AD-802-E10_MRT_200m]|nr:signal peptidase II [SAR202 cluster bacterium AD-802-E10_MRT_200m]